MMNLNRVLIWIISFLNQWYIKRIEMYNFSIPNNEDNYEALIPNTQENKKNFYDNPFKVALRTPNVNNIAITGPYGSGKSSFLRNFEKYNSGWNYLLISLATFKETKDNTNNTILQDDNENEDKDEASNLNLHQDIERSILQQFFYREKDKTIPFSRFKKIKKVSKIDILLLSLSIPYLYLYIFRPTTIQRLIPKDITIFIHEYNFIFLGLAILLFFAGLYRFLYFLGSFQISKFDLKKNSITIAKQDKASILNEHLDEILYFFEATNYNVIIFEDIDRFNNTEIFVKLRELNNLVNNSKEINRRIVFVYAIRDDMFIDKERTKFFDFIIPIIPYINPSNSEQKLLEKFKSEIESKTLNEHFLSQISLYIDDMRLLLNIYNEYMIYKNNLNSSKLDHNKLLALIVYKNFYPLDFAELHIRKGLVYELFANKPQYIKNTIEKFNLEKEEKIAELKKLRQDIEKENLQSIRELRLSILADLFEKTNAEKLTIGQYQQKSIYELMAIEDLLETINNKTTVVGYQRYSYNNYQESKRIGFNNAEYLRRKEIIETKYDAKIDFLKAEIEKLTKKIDRLKKASLKELFEVVPEEIITDTYKDKDLLIFLARNGYIDEHYEYYISYFHEGGITQDDREFLLSIQNHSSLAYTAQLGNIPKLLEKLEERDFESEYILNNQLTSHFLKSNNQKISKKKELYFMKISDGSDKSIEFIFQYIDNATDEEKELFVKQIRWDDLWSYIYENLSRKEQNRYFRLFFKTLSVDKLVELDMSSYLSNQKTLPNYNDKENEKCQELINRLDLKFKYITNPSENFELFTYIYNNNHYELNPDMIRIILEEQGEVDESQFDKLQNKNLTIIRESKAKKLIDYIHNNINQYFENVLQKLNDDIYESEDALIYLLNHNDLATEYKQDIVKKTKSKISDITTIENKELWADLFTANRVQANWDNVLYYYENLEEQEIDNPLINYLNNEENYKILSNMKINNEEVFDKDETLEPFNRKLILLSDLSDEAYSYLIKSIWFINYSSLPLEKLSTPKIDSILTTKILSLTQDNINILKENFLPKHIILIENNKDDFLEKFSSFNFELDDILNILDSSKFNNEEKFQIIQNIDLELFENILLKEKVSKIYIDSNKQIENTSLFEKLFYGENQYDLELLISQIQYFENCDAVKQYLESLEEQQYQELLEISASKHYMDDTSINRELLKKLEEKNCISSWKENKKTIGENNLKVERKRKKEN